jgi:hypothetical protein
MAVTIDTTGQYAGDGYGKALPVGLQTVDTTGKVIPILSAVAPSVPVTGMLILVGDDLKAWTGAAWKKVTLAP